ncbi:MAG: glycine--tRNA ligase subunit beta [Endozoicomonas sp. (ex Botrylloides leachii)]|nr:glycine--tRNA ligase subunit beta [Endozoicomonas sp. (ex Botrylloides leachii)]
MNTQDFLVELGTEELPPKALKKLSAAFTDGILSRLDAAQIGYGAHQSFATPRRLALLIKRLETAQPSQTIERLGPAVDAPEKAVVGFAKSCGISIDKLEPVKTPKGTRLGYRYTKQGVETYSLLAEMVSQSLSNLPIPKRMRWGAHRDEFVRPVHWLVMLLGNKIVDCNILGLQAGKQSFGHRFHANQSITINSPADYQQILKTEGYVIADFSYRRDIIRSQVMLEAEKLKGTAVICNDLLDEVTALVEWPVALSGHFDETFLSVPDQALISTMKEHQKYFHVIDEKGSLKPHFITVSNIKSREPKQEILGNERVIRPRLSDAKFFFEKDKKITLKQRREELKLIVFQSKLGSIFDKTERIAVLAKWIAEQEGSNGHVAEKAGRLSKSDLVSEMVLEFPELQGIMGQYYAKHDGEEPEVCTAINEQYMPRFSGDDLPFSITGSALAIADKIDTIVGIFGVGLLPTGSKDPFALRRASIGVLRIIVEKKLNLDLRNLIKKAAEVYKSAAIELSEHKKIETAVFAYIMERFDASYQEKGVAAEVINAVKALSPSRPLDFDQRIKAVCRFYEMKEAKSLSSANKRVSNIMAKAGDFVIPDIIDESLLKEVEEVNLKNALISKKEEIRPLLDQGRYAVAMESLVDLKDPVDIFFDKVLVNSDNQAVKLNRYALLKQLRSLFLHVADISLLQKA